MFFPGMYPAVSIDFTITLSASSFELKSGAYPPSSPTLVLRPLSSSIPFNAWNTSLAALKDSLNVLNFGTIINSCISILFEACFPPFIILNIQKGIFTSLLFKYL